MLKGKKFLVGVTGSIAAYKIAWLIRLLVKDGAQVRVIMTEAATNFISPLTLGTLSNNEVLYQLADNSSWANHVMLGRWADIFLIAPLSCNSLSKMANASCDNLLLAVYLSATCPVVVAPAMDEDMWKHPGTQKNIEILRANKNFIIPVNNGALASGLSGEGRMAEPEEIMQWLNMYFLKSNTLSGKKILITAGPTYEKIDPVRFLGNASTGKMGIALAEELKNRGAEVTLVLGPSTEQVPIDIRLIRVTTADEMYAACLQYFADSDWAIMCAAVADYKPVNQEKQKIKKQEDSMQLDLIKTRDILKKLGELKKDHQCLIGFALETNNEKEFALKKLQSKNADIIVLNSLNNAGAGFGSSSNKITIFNKKGGEYSFDLKPKSEIATDIINNIINYVS